MKKRILVVDDDESILEVMQLVLEDEGYNVQTSLNGACFLHMNSDLPDLILLDVLLSGEDGREICKRLKSEEKTRHIPVIMHSAHYSASMIAETSGADGFLVKPFHIDELIDVVKRYLSPIHIGNHVQIKPESQL